jgi:hypothetical protein
MPKHLAIKTFFEGNNGRKVEGQELIALRKAGEAGYEELAKLSAEALGVSLDEK